MVNSVSMAVERGSRTLVAEVIGKANPSQLTMEQAPEMVERLKDLAAKKDISPEQMLNMMPSDVLDQIPPEVRDAVQQGLSEPLRQHHPSSECRRGR